MLHHKMMRMISLQNYFSELTKVFAGPGPGQGGLDEAEKVRQRHPAVRHKWVFHHSHHHHQLHNHTHHHHHDKTIVSFKTRQNLLSSSLTSTGQVFGFRGCSFFVPFYIPRISQGLSLRKETDVWHVLTIIIFSFFCNILRIFGLLCICLLHRNRCVTSGLPLNTTTWLSANCSVNFVEKKRHKNTPISHHQPNDLKEKMYIKHCFRPCQPWDGDVEGLGPNGGHCDAEGGRGGRHRRRLPEVRRRHQGARRPHEEHGELFTYWNHYPCTLPLSLPKNHYERPNRKIFGFNTHFSAGRPCLLW